MSEWGDKLLTESDNARLRAENDKLRERVHELEELTDGKLYIPQEWYQLATAENAKLRELLTDLAICACGKYCYGCPHQYDGCNRDERLRELGIEVDE